MKPRLFRRRLMQLLLSISAAFAIEPSLAQPTPPDAGTFQARVDAAARSLADNPRFKGLSAQYRQQIVEFVAGNMLFVLLHELGHAAISEMGLPVLGREEDAADSFAATRLIRIGPQISNEVLTEAAKGWFMADRRDQDDGEVVPYYDAHGLNQVRAYQIVCFLVGSDKDKFKTLATETKLPEDRQNSCAEDYSKAANSWSLVLAPHLRAPDAAKTQIDVVYGEAKGRLEIAAKALRSMQLLEIVAQRTADQLAWPTPFTLEMQTCGFINARWVPSARKLTLCYELAADFAELYRSYGTAKAEGKQQVHKRGTAKLAKPTADRGGGAQECEGPRSKAVATRRVATRTKAR